MRRFVGPALAASLIGAMLLSVVETGPAPAPWRKWDPSPERVGLAFAGLGIPGFGSGGPSLGGSNTWSGAQTFASTITSTVASGSTSVQLTSGARFNGGDTYWYTDATSGGRWITPGGLYVAGEADFAGVLQAQSNLDAANAIINSTANPVTAYDAQGFCVDDGSGAAFVCDGKLAHGLDVTTVQTLTVADNSAGSNATATLTPTSAYVNCTCNDTNGCDVTMGETSVADGTIVRIVSTTTHACNFADTSGVSELTGAVALGQYDSLTLLYVSDRWVELAASNN